MVRLAREHGFAAKLAGSGGAVIGLWTGENDDALQNARILILKKKLQKEGFTFCWVKPQGMWTRF
jgi:hypothetical protein